MRNWNDGKSQEYLDRKTYLVENAQKRFAPKRERKTVKKTAEKYYLYTTATCPGCRIIRPLLEKAGIPFEQRDVEAYMEEAQALGLTQAPSLVDPSDPPMIYAGVAGITDFLNRSAR